MIFVFLDADREELDRLQGSMKASFLKMDMRHKWPHLFTIQFCGYRQHDLEESKVSWHLTIDPVEYEDERSDEDGSMHDSFNESDSDSVYC